ncbi:GHMP kinase [Acidobacteria bacterium AH-259-D05]|nr:GHMP kinase [Acidobacteria bacterium AH-259-D05]
MLRASAPTRIDLAGGTLDIHPLYLFEGGGLTLNVAIDLCTEVELEKRSDQWIRIEATDLDLVLEGSGLEELKSKGKFAPLDLVLRILNFYKPGCGLTVRTRSNVPPGSGLGGSSSLLVCLSTALIQLENLPFNKAQIIDLGANIETQSIRVPTGKQDYFPPAYGGFSALWLELQGVRREKLELSRQFKNQLQHQMLLGYTGATRFSGASNWSMMKRYIDGEDDTVARMRKIKETALAMYESLKQEDLNKFAQCLSMEWDNRKGLAEGVTTQEIERIFTSAAQAGALANKICGAGGGGCFVSLVRDGCRQAVSKAIQSNGGQILDYRFADSGVQVIE